MNINKIKSDYDFAVHSCCDSGCKLNMAGAKNYVALKGEKISKAKICDCLIFSNHPSTLLTMVELRSSSSEVSKILQKLQNGTSKGVDILKSVHDDGKYEFQHILLTHRYSHWSAFERLRRSKIIFQGKKYPIKLKKCGAKFLKIIS